MQCRETLSQNRMKEERTGRKKGGRKEGRNKTVVRYNVTLTEIDLLKFKDCKYCRKTKLFCVFVSLDSVPLAWNLLIDQAGCDSQ